MIQYLIEYPQLGIKQIKFLISHDLYLEYKVDPKMSKKEVDALIAGFKRATEGKEWFTDKSPLFLLKNRKENGNIIEGEYVSKYMSTSVRLTKIL